MWCVVCGVWCMVCGVWCVVCCVWCVVCGVCVCVGGRGRGRVRARVRVRVRVRVRTRVRVSACVMLEHDARLAINFTDQFTGTQKCRGLNQKPASEAWLGRDLPGLRTHSPNSRSFPTGCPWQSGWNLGRARAHLRRPKQLTVSWLKAKSPT